MELTSGEQDYREYGAAHNLLRLAELIVEASLTPGARSRRPLEQRALALAEAVVEAERVRLAERQRIVEASQRARTEREARLLAVVAADKPAPSGSTCTVTLRTDTWQRTPTLCRKPAKVRRTFSEKWETDNVAIERTMDLCGVHRYVRGRYGWPWDAPRGWRPPAA